MHAKRDGVKLYRTYENCYMEVGAYMKIQKLLKEASNQGEYGLAVIDSRKKKTCMLICMCRKYQDAVKYREVLYADGETDVIIVPPFNEDEKTVPPEETADFFRVWYGQ